MWPGLLQEEGPRRKTRRETHSEQIIVNPDPGPPLRESEKKFEDLLLAILAQTSTQDGSKVPNHRPLLPVTNAPKPGAGSSS